MTDSTHITQADFASLVKQANLTLTPHETKTIRTQLDEALMAVKVLEELDTSQVAQATSASGLSNVLREDVVTKCLTQAEALQNAPSVHQGYFMVPAIFEEQDN